MKWGNQCGTVGLKDAQEAASKLVHRLYSVARVMCEVITMRAVIYIPLET